MKILFFLIILYLDTVLGDGACPFLQNQEQIVQENPALHGMSQDETGEHLTAHCNSETVHKLGDAEPQPDTTTVLGCECASVCGATIDFGRAHCDWCYTKDKCGHWSVSRRKYYDYCIYPRRSEVGDWATKEAILYEQLIANTTMGEMTHTMGMMLEDVQASFDINWDVMPTGRKKMIHAIGAVCKINLTITDTAYTGIFEQGVTSGFMRMGPARPPMKRGGHVPGIGFKFMRTGVESANFVSLYSIEGIKGYDFFSVDQSNHFQAAGGITAKFMEKFEQASNCASKVGLSNSARYNQNGEETEDPRFPYKLVFKATTEAKTIMTNDPKLVDEIMDAFKTIQIGTKLWNVYAQAWPGTNQHDIIGHITTTTACDTSAFGDTSFFIQHQRVEEDWQLRPEWIPDIDPNECRIGMEKILLNPPPNCMYEENKVKFEKFKKIKNATKAIIAAFKKGIDAGVEFVHELEVTFNRGVHKETCIPGVYTYNGFHDIVEEVLNTHVKHEVGILKGSAALVEVTEKLKGQKRTPEVWAEIQQGVRDVIGNQDLHFPNTLDTMQLITLMTHNPFFTMGMHFDQETDQYCFDATKNSPNRLASLVFSAFDDDYACSKLFFSKDLTEVTLEVQGQTYTESDGDVFQKKLRPFITSMLYWFQSCHATLHVYSYVMLGSANKAVYTTKLQEFVKQYEPNILIKYVEVKATLFGGTNVLMGGDNTWKVTDTHAASVAHLEIFKTYAGARNSREWLKQVFLADCPEMMHEHKIQKQAKKYSKMFPHLSDATMDALRKQFDTDLEFVEEVAQVSDYLVDYLRHTDGGFNSNDNYFGINTFQDWIECTGMAGVLHGNTLSLTRLQYTDYMVYSGEWDTDIVEDQASSTVAMGTLLGLEKHRAVNHFKEMQNTPFEEMMMLFYDQTVVMQKNFWDKLSIEDKEKYTWVKSVWGPNMVDSTQLTVTSYI